MDETHGALTQLRAFLAKHNLPVNTRLPSERELCERLGVTRSELRKALSVLEESGELWRHVGKGTFIGPKPIVEDFSVGVVAARSSPAEVMHARLVVEPLIAGEAALNATSVHITELRLCLKLAKEAKTWREYENSDNRFHRTISEASGNGVLEALFDQLNAIRRTVVWGRLRQEFPTPPSDHSSFAEHGLVLDAIEQRDSGAARKAMHDHLSSVQKNLQLMQDQLYSR